MARLNEPPTSMDSFETLRRKLLRQNRDLAKLNNVRALRIRELENECACMLSENVELRGKIIELEKQVEDNETRRIADHALTIKAKLESQLTQWGELIAGLGLEPPPKRHSPSIRASTKRRTTFNPNRLSPSQRRLRDVARDIEDLGHISEHKTYPRKSMNPEQILALRCEVDDADSADSADLATSPELGPPPVSDFIEDAPVKVESPVANSPEQYQPSPKGRLEPPVTFQSPQAEQPVAASPSPQKSPSPVKAKDVPAPEALEQPKKRFEPRSHKFIVTESPTATPTKAGVKRKFAPSETNEIVKSPSKTDENQQPRMLTSKSGSIRERTGGKTLKQLTNMRKEERPASSVVRKPLSSKSTNDDVGSPRKRSRTTLDGEITATKPGLSKPKMKPLRDQPKAKAKNTVSKPPTIKAELEPPAAPAAEASDLGIPVAEPELLTPNSPEPTPAADAARGDTPPPADISSKGETSRASRRSRGVVSYAEPNLRDKMRRPTKDMVDAVTGSRRSSQFDLLESHESNKVKRESSLDGFLEARSQSQEPASPLAGKGPSSAEELPHTIAAERRRRPSSAAFGGECVKGSEELFSKDESIESISSTDVDVYDFSSSSPNTGKQAQKKRGAGGRARSSRRFSAALDEDNFMVAERSSSRRRSMMI